MLSSPIFVLPWKNSTLLTLPVDAAALALTVMLAGALNVALLAGAVIVTVGGALTVRFTGAEVPTVPLVLVAWAVTT